MSHKLTRRAMVMSLAAGITSSTGRADFAAKFSQDYYACKRTWIVLERLRLSQTDVCPSESEIEAQTIASEAYRRAKAALLQRPVETIFDIIALLRTNVWQGGNFIRVREWAVDSDELKTLRAVETMAQAPAWRVPGDLITLDAEKEAKEAARRKNLPPREGSDDWLEDKNWLSQDDL